MGYSLGTGVAAQNALEERPAALVLLAPFASIAATARMHFPWLPAGLLVTQRFATVDKLGRIACPVLLLHGAADTTVPPPPTSACSPPSGRTRGRSCCPA